MESISWLTAGTRLFAIAAIATLLGWLYGYPLQALVLVLVVFVLFWLQQMQRVQLWLQDPQQPPPDAFGVWSELMARIYKHQRKHRDIQQQLQANVNYLQNSFACMRDGVIMVDAEGDIKWLNAATGPLLGLRFPYDSGQRLTNLVRAPEFTRYFLAADYSAPLQYRVGGVQPRHLRIEVTPFGRGERLVFVRDVSEAVRLEQSRRDFIANVSHELRTPLTVISGYLDTLVAAAPELQAQQARALQQMQQQARRMESLIKDLLWLSRLENDDREKSRQSVDVGALLQELQEEFSHSHPEREIRLALETECRISGNYRELYSAVSNLLTNALKYSGADSPVSLRWYSAGDECIVSVVDRGIGIDEVCIPRLTERFYRVDDSRSSRTGGTGLGLAIVKHVVAGHQGELKILSEPGVGSEFALIFPAGG